MKAYIDLNGCGSICYTRLIKALTEYTPNIEIVEDMAKSDIIIINVNGRRDKVLKATKKILSQGKSYAIIQHCLRSTKNKNTSDWLDIWKNAKVVWSAYNLRNKLKEDGNDLDFNFYHAPFGVDDRIFYPLNMEKKYLACTTGVSYLGESVREVILAAQQVGGKVAHLGTADIKEDGVDCFTNITDKEVNELYNQCHFVSGLRRIEGFEFPAAEGLLTGATPILYDAEHYTDWYHGVGEFIPETGREQIVTDLVELFKKERKEVNKEYILEGKKRFNWEKIVTNFWRSCNG